MQCASAPVFLYKVLAYLNSAGTDVHQGSYFLVRNIQQQAGTKAYFTGSNVRIQFF